jgi:hypothetical protein
MIFQVLPDDIKDKGGRRTMLLSGGMKAQFLSVSGPNAVSPGDHKAAKVLAVI